MILERILVMMLLWELRMLEIIMFDELLVEMLFNWFN